MFLGDHYKHYVQAITLKVYSKERQEKGLPNALLRVKPVHDEHKWSICYQGYGHAIIREIQFQNQSHLQPHSFNTWINTNNNTLSRQDVWEIIIMIGLKGQTHQTFIKSSFYNKPILLKDKLKADKVWRRKEIWTSLSIFNCTAIIYCAFNDSKKEMWCLML